MYANYTNDERTYSIKSKHDLVHMLTGDSLSLSLSLHFNGHFPGEPGLAGV